MWTPLDAGQASKSSLLWSSEGPSPRHLQVTQSQTSDLQNCKRITCLVLSRSVCDNSLQQPSKLRRPVHGEAGGMGTIPFPLVAAPQERLPRAPSSQGRPRGCSGQMRTHLPLGSGWFRNGHMDTWPRRLLQGGQLAGCALELSGANSVCRWEGLLRMEMMRRKKAET